MSQNETVPVTQDLARSFGLSDAEYEVALDLVGRTPKLAELGIISAMWSEHCSYKSSRVHLAKLPTEAPWVIHGPGENAGVIDIGEGLACVFKMESHNHPSYIEPYQGAATGVGGIMRDVFTMGARPIANLNALRFGAPDHPRTRYLVGGVVAGIGGYGNCMGVPTVGGECEFDPAYNGNILVNAMTVGLAPTDRIFTSAAAGVGNPVVYVGAKTGRDGIHGATMASAEFGADAEAKRPTVQVGDPFKEKLLLEACLELMAEDAIIAIQDMGAAGLTSSAMEMADKGGLGIDLDLDQVPLREPGMSAYEIMLSESQERMLMVLKPEAEARARAIFEKWDLDFAVIGTLTDTGRLVLRRFGEVAADLEVAPLVGAAPKYDRPWEPIALPVSVDIPTTDDPMAALEALLGHPSLSDKAWIFEQYDAHVMADTVQGPGGDAAVVRIHGSDRALALTSDCTPRYVAAHPVTGGMQAVAEAYRNLSAVGALPRAVTNNLNFGNPERPHIMGQIVGALDGMAQACEALDMPIVSGNVSLYNETEGRAILPTPVIGAVGLLADCTKAARIALPEDGLTLLLIGTGTGHLGRSRYLEVLFDRRDGPPPPVDLAAEKAHGSFVRAMIAAGQVHAAHDVSDGGLLVAIAEMAIAGGIGATLTLPGDVGTLFGEDQGRYVLAVRDPEPVHIAAEGAGIPLTVIGKTGGERLQLDTGASILLERVSQVYRSALPRLMA